jgi:MraZ protein
VGLATSEIYAARDEFKTIKSNIKYFSKPPVFFKKKWYIVEKSGGDAQMRGLTAVQIDSKGRLSIPARYRSVLTTDNENQVVVTIDTEQPCLLLYPVRHWAEIQEKLEKLPSFHSPSRRIQRLLLGHATDLEIDTQNRILLPGLLREYANLEKSAVLVGQGKKLEVWNDEKWNTSRSAWLAEAADQEGGLSAEILALSL